MKSTAAPVTKQLRPPFPYYGGKQRIARKIVDLLPEHGHYVEPFFGGGSILFAKPVSAKETVNDLDGRIVNFWRVLRDQGEALEVLCALTPHSAEELTISFDPADDPLEDARRVFVMLTQGRGARTSKTGWRNIIDPNNPTPFNGFLKGYLARFGPAIERMINVSIEHKDAFDVIKNYGKHEGVCLYLDPPYLGTTRASRGYALEAADEQFHEQLLSLVVVVDAAVVISGYPADLYEEYLWDWDRYEISARANGSAETGGDARTEVVWVNR